MINVEDFWSKVPNDVKEYLSHRYFLTTRCLLSEEQEYHIAKSEAEFIKNKLLDEMKPGDFILFPFTWNGDAAELMGAKITSVHKGKFLVHFLYGHHSLGEWVDRGAVIAVGGANYVEKVNGWRGNYNLLQPSHKLLIDN